MEFALDHALRVEQETLDEFNASIENLRKGRLPSPADLSTIIVSSGSDTPGAVRVEGARAPGRLQSEVHPLVVFLGSITVSREGLGNTPENPAGGGFEGGRDTRDRMNY